MKKLRGQGSNCFDSNELARYYDEYQKCAMCGEYNATDFHHNIERARKYSNSIINAIPLGRNCHNNNADFTTPERQRQFFEWNMRWLLSRGYVINEQDQEYLVEYRDILGL